MKKVWEYLKRYAKEHPVSMSLSVVFVVIVYTVLFTTINATTKRFDKELSFEEFEQKLIAGDVDLVYYNSSEQYMRVVLFNEKTKQLTMQERQEEKHERSEQYKVLYPGQDSMFPYYDEDLVVDENKTMSFRQAVIVYGAIPIYVSSSSMTTSLFSLLGTVIIYAIMFLFMMKLMNMQARGISEKDVIQTSTVKFENIIGHDEIIEDVHFITDLIKDPTKGDKIGAKLPKGILFAGPPGTGKTLLAKAIANEAGVPFLYQNASGFIEMYVGLGARRVRDLFKIARKNAPCIIFLDEIDAIGGNRDSGRGTSENEQTINALLQEMDGFSGRDGIFIIAATNRPETLDPALVRSGRFDRQIDVNPPRDWVVRRDMFKHYLEQFTIADDLNLESISKQVSGFTGADIAMVCNEASIIAVMQNKESIDGACIEEAIEKKIFNGNRTKSRPPELDMKITAYHEAGHAVMNYLTGTPIARASIQPTTSGIGGYVSNRDKVTVYVTKREMENAILVAYAGRASEIIKFSADEATTGASNDITKATNIIKKYACKLGFDGDIGLIDTDELIKSNIIDSTWLEQKVSDISKKMFDRCMALLQPNYHMVELVAEKLIESETLSGTEIEEMLQSVKKVGV